MTKDRVWPVERLQILTLEVVSLEMTKAAFATWNNRIAPVFDVARSIQLVETQSGQIIYQTQADVSGDVPSQKAWHLAEMEVNTLVCGAISRPLQIIIAAYSIEIIPFVAGDLQEVIQAWVDGKLAGATAYAMPGCRSAGGRRFKGPHGTDRRENKMKDNKRGKKGAAGQGSGCGGKARQGQGGGRQRQGRGGRTTASGFGASATQSTCICPKCGHQAPHERGVPCMQLKCAQCGTLMTRQ